MTIPKNQKLAIAAIIVVGAALSGAMLTTGRHADKDEKQKPESVEKTTAQEPRTAVAEKDRPGARDDDDKRGAKEAPKSADVDHDGSPEEKKSAEKQGEKREDKDGATRSPKKISLAAAEIQSAGIKVAVAGPGTVSRRFGKAMSWQLLPAAPCRISEAIC
jgi:hypothetical protein